MDNLRRPTLDTSGAQQGLARVSDALANPMIDPSPFVRPFEAVEDIGRAIARTGSVVGAAAAKQQEALGIRQYGDFRANYINEQSAFEAERDKMPPEQWGEAWAKRLQKLKDSADSDSKLNPDGRARITQFLALEGAESAGMVAKLSRERINRNAADVLEADILKAIEDQNEERFEGLVNQAEAGFYQTKLDSFRQRQAFKAYGIDKAEKEGHALINIGIESGDLGPVEKGLQLLKAKTKASDSEIEAKRLKAKAAVADTVEANRNKAEAEFVGQVFLRKAQGETFVPAQADGWVKEGKVDAATGARLRVAFQSDVGAMTGEFHDFLNDKVDTYDSSSDPKFEKLINLRKEAKLLGMNEEQEALFDLRLKRAAALTGPERARESVLIAGRKMIGEALKDFGKVRTWDSDAQKLLSDPAKLQEFGFSKTKAEEIVKNLKGSGWFSSDPSKGDPAKALRLFKEQAKARVAAKPAGLTDAEWNKLVKLSEDDETTISPEAIMRNEFSRAVLEEELNSWYEHTRLKTGKTPTDVEVRDWVGQKTRAVIQGTGIATMFKIEEPKRPSIADVAEAKASAKPLTGDLISRVKEFESFKSKAYDDYAQISIGYGTEAQSLDDTITEEEATVALQNELTASARRVDAAAKRYRVELNNNQRNALISFDFNTGDAPRVLERSAGDLSKVAGIMAEWHNVTENGKKVPSNGLINRRKAEGEWFNTP